MHQNKQRQQQDKHQLITRDSKSLSSSTTTIRLSHLLERLQKKTYKDRRHHRSHNHKRYNRQNYKPRRYFPRCGLGFLIFLSAIKVSFATVYSTSYLLSLDVTTAVPQTHFLPYFDFDVPRNITVTVGQTGFLHCRVERLGDKDVSWIRKRDLHILTAGSTTYTSDQRFQVLRPDNSGNLTLQIKYPQPRDSGIYECQINTEPKMSLSYTFNVVELKATIVGPTDLYVKSGSDINLTCRIIQGPHELGNIFWYKGSEIIEMATNQNEIDSGTRITVDNDWSDGLTSRLKIRRASSSDTGNYTCVPTIAKSSSVYVHVIIGEHPAAMQHNASTAHCGSFYINLGCMLVAILTCFLEHLLCTNTNSSGMTKTTSLTTTLATKGASTSAPSLIIANATGTATRTVQSASVSPSTSKTKARQRNISPVSKVLPSKPFSLSLELCIKSKQFPKPTLNNFSTTTSLAASATSTYCKRRTSFFASDRNFR